MQRKLDSIRFIAEPTEKARTHVTVGGPFDDASHVKKPTLQTQGSSLHILGVGSFFSERQNTVFLKCDSEYLKRVWNKKHYGYNPHITIYDGSDRDFAVSLYQELNRQRIFFNVQIGDVELLSTVKGQQAFDLMLAVDWDFIRWAAGRSIDNLSVRHFMPWERKMIIYRMLSRLTHDDEQYIPSSASALG